MKRLTIQSFLFTISLLISLQSCEKFFEPGSDTYLDQEESFNDFLSSRSAVNGLYALMQDVMDAYIVNGELKGDMLTTTGMASKELQEIYNMEFSLQNPYLDILPFYTIISNANDVIIHLEKEVEKGTSYEEELLNMHAEAVILRSWVYFYLLRNYTNVPYLTDDYTATAAEGTIEEWLETHSSQKLSLDDIIADTEEVIANLIPDYYTESEFFNIASSNAFLGEMYLWKNDYNSAIDALLVSAHSAGDYRFILDLDLEKSKWPNIFKGDESAADEIMTKIIFSKGEKQQNDLLNLFSQIGITGQQLSPINESIEALSGSLRFGGTFKNANEIGKYTRSLDNPFTSDMPVILYRAADVHLMLAEAYNRSGNPELALDLLNNGSDSLFTPFSKGVRGRVSLPPLKIEGASMQDSIIDLENKILSERSMELAFEGKRWYDLVRIAQRRNDTGFMLEMMEKKYSDTELQNLEGFFQDQNNWYIPLDY
jgi:hypothetical protein